MPARSDDPVVDAFLQGGFAVDQALGPGVRRQGVEPDLVVIVVRSGAEAVAEGQGLVRSASSTSKTDNDDQIPALPPAGGLLDQRLVYGNRTLEERVDYWIV